MSITSNSSLSSKSLAAFENRLREQQRELQRAMEKAEEEMRALYNSGSGDAVDDSCDNASKESVFVSYSYNRTRLRKVELAMERISTHDFGVCVDCRSTIGIKRLKAMPWASNCIECQKQAEERKVGPSLALGVSLSV